MIGSDSAHRHPMILNFRGACVLGVLSCAGLLGSVLGGCADDTAEQQANATRALQAAAREYGTALDAETLADRAEALRRVASKASSLQGASEGQIAAGALLAAGASAEACRVELSRATALLGDVQRAGAAAERLASVAATLSLSAEAIDAAPLESAVPDEIRNSVASALSALRTAERELRDVVERTTTDAEAARADAADALQQANELLESTATAMPIDRLAANEEARVARGAAIEAQTVAALATIEGSAASVELAVVAVDAAAVSTITDSIQAADDWVSSLDDDRKAAAAALRDEASRLAQQAEAIVTDVQGRVGADLKASLEAAVTDGQNADSKSRTAQRAAAQAAAARMISAQTQLDIVRAQLMLAEAGLAESASALGEALAMANEAVQAVGDEALSNALVKLQAAARGERMPSPQGDAGMDGGSDAGSAEDGTDAGDGSDSGADSVRNTGGLASPDEILAILSGQSSDFAQWGQALGTRDESLAPAVGLLRMFAEWFVPVAEASVEKWGSASAVLMQAATAEGTTPTLQFDGGETATIEVSKADGSTSTLQLFSQDGRWFVDVASLADTPEAAAQMQQMAQMGPMMTMLQPAIQAAAADVAEQIRSGAIAAPTDVQPALQQAIATKSAEVMQKLQGG